MVRSIGRRALVSAASVHADYTRQVANLAGARRILYEHPTFPVGEVLSKPRKDEIATFSQPHLIILAAFNPKTAPIDMFRMQTIMDGLQRMGKTFELVVPYFPHLPIMIAFFAGVERITTIDLPAMPNSVDRSRINNLSSCGLFGESFVELLGRDPFVLISSVSPGGENFPNRGKLYRWFDRRFSSQSFSSATMEPRYSRSGKKLNRYQIWGDIAERPVVIHRKTLLSSERLKRMIDAVRGGKASRFLLGITHAAMPDSCRRILENSEIDNVLLTDTIGIPGEKLSSEGEPQLDSILHPKFRVLSTAALIGSALRK